MPSWLKSETPIQQPPVPDVVHTRLVVSRAWATGMPNAANTVLSPFICRESEGLALVMLPDQPRNELPAEG